MNNTLLFALFFVVILFSCSDNTDKVPVLSLINPPSFDLSKPSKVYYLPAVLDEISGIDFLGNDRVACVQDEKGIIFIYNLASEKIEEEIAFGPDGDYEDLVKAGSSYFVLKSNGTLLQVENGKTNTYNTSIDPSCDAEGLGYDSIQQHLLISCKNGNKAIWQFDLREKKLFSKPLFRIKQKGFRPTAITIEKAKGLYYILSTKQILILNSSGAITETLELKNDLFSQAEGITFKDNGDLLISNEAKGNQATILEFKNGKDSI